MKVYRISDEFGCVWFAGFSWRGQCWTEHHTGRGEGVEGQCQHTGADAVPGRSSTLSVLARYH